MAGEEEEDEDDDDDDDDEDDLALSAKLSARERSSDISAYTCLARELNHAANDMLATLSECGMRLLLGGRGHEDG